MGQGVRQGIGEGTKGSGLGGGNQDLGREGGVGVDAGSILFDLWDHVMRNRTKGQQTLRQSKFHMCCCYKWSWQVMIWCAELLIHLLWRYRCHAESRECWLGTHRAESAG